MCSTRIVGFLFEWFLRMFSSSERFISIYADNRLRWSFGVQTSKYCFPVQLHSLILCFVCNNCLFIYSFIVPEKNLVYNIPVYEVYSYLNGLPSPWNPANHWVLCFSSTRWENYKGWEGVSNMVFFWRDAQAWRSSLLALPRQVANLLGILQSSFILSSPWLLRSEWAEVDVFIGSLVLISLF